MSNELKVGDVVFTQSQIMGCPYPIFYKVVGVYREHYRIEALSNTSLSTKINKATLTECGNYYYGYGGGRAFVKVDADKVTDQIIWFTQKEWAFANIAAEANKAIDKANDAMGRLRGALHDLKEIPKIDVERWR